MADTHQTQPGTARADRNAPGFHHVALRALDFDATARFYQDGLGFTPAHGWGEGDGRALLLDAGDGNYLEIFAGGQAPPAPDGGSPQAAGLLHFALRTPDVDAAHARALGAGAADHLAPKDVSLGGVPVRLAFVRGLDGELIEFFSNRAL